MRKNKLFYFLTESRRLVRGGRKEKQNWPRSSVLKMYDMSRIQRQPPLSVLSVLAFSAGKLEW